MGPLKSRWTPFKNSEYFGHLRGPKDPFLLMLSANPALDWASSKTQIKLWTTYTLQFCYEILSYTMHWFLNLEQCAFQTNGWNFSTKNATFSHNSVDLKKKKKKKIWRSLKKYLNCLISRLQNHSIIKNWLTKFIPSRTITQKSIQTFYIPTSPMDLYLRQERGKKL